MHKLTRQPIVEDEELFVAFQVHHGYRTQAFAQC